jgi:hypothetical protein
LLIAVLANNIRDEAEHLSEVPVATPTEGVDMSDEDTIIDDFDSVELAEEFSDGAVDDTTLVAVDSDADDMTDDTITDQDTNNSKEEEA